MQWKVSGLKTHYLAYAEKQLNSCACALVPNECIEEEVVGGEHAGSGGDEEDLPVLFVASARSLERSKGTGKQGR